MDPASLTDAELIERCRRDRDALHASFRALYERHAQAVFRFLCSMVGESQATDCLQETFLRLYRSLERYDPRRSFLAWALGIARNVALDARRREARRPAEPLSTAEPPDPRGADAVPVEAARREEQGLLQDAVRELPAREREVFLLKQVEGLTFAEVADAVGCSLRTAKYRMRAAVDLLADGLRRRGVVGECP